MQKDAMPLTPSAIKPSVFLERRSYRQRRMMDAVRLLPLVGMILWMVPVLWPVADVGLTNEVAPAPRTVNMSQAITYVFCVWIILILCTAGLWARLGKSGSETVANQDPETDKF